MFNLSCDKEEEALVLIKKIYHPSEDYKAILADLKLQVQKKPSQKLGFIDGLFGRKYLRATIIALVVTSLCQQSSVNVFCMFSNRIVTKINEGMPEENQVKANLAT
jgi:predicted transcriptional regulator with HTH domain